MSTLVLGIALMSLSAVPEESIVRLFEDRKLVYSGGEYRDETFHYRLLKPTQLEPGKKYPLVLFLHGAGERGADNVSQLQYLPEQMATEPWRSQFPCFLIAPQCRKDKRWVEVPWDARHSSSQIELGDQMRVVLMILDAIEKEFPIDPQRVMLTGLSMGGYGSWDLATRFPERFSAVAPVCGGGDEKTAARLAHTPLWAWHGDADKAVPVERSRTMIAAVRAAGGAPKYSELPGVGHNSWTPAYTSSPDGLIAWMFAQTNTRRKP